MAGKCPKCEIVLGSALIQDITLGDWRGVAYVCPNCLTIIGCQIDPIAIKTDTIDAIKQLLRQQK